MMTGTGSLNPCIIIQESRSRVRRSFLRTAGMAEKQSNLQEEIEKIKKERRIDVAIENVD